LVCPPELDELDELGELEPHAAITVAAAIAAAVRELGDHARCGRRMMRVRSLVMRCGV
jgi:plasmid stabilization system protein ParE